MEKIFTLENFIDDIATFDEIYYYDGGDLGANYSKEKTTFKLWAPLADKVELLIYQSGDIRDNDKPKNHEMEKRDKGIWAISISEDLNNTFYTYRVYYGEIINESYDPYAKACGVNGNRSCVIDLSMTNPDGFLKTKSPQFTNSTDCLIYELHVRDFSIDESSGIKNKGKYIAFTEENTTNKYGVATGISHLKELGVTHIHLLPTYDYGSIDEAKIDEPQYNWGYDPKNYQIPEGSYSTNPFEPSTRIKEYKQMVMSLKQNGFRVISDVVFNHTFESVNSAFHKIFPGYYYRMKDTGEFYDATYCGNETASERLMFKKYIVDTVKYWVKEYGIDGYRFDLMGIHDLYTMNEVRRALDEINPEILVYGEGWDMGNHSRESRAIQIFSDKMPRVGFFNDNFRDSFKGFVLQEDDRGYVNGKKYCELEIMQGIVGGVHYNDIVTDYNSDINQAIQYTEVHDNHTLWDRLVLSDENYTEDDLIKRHTLANTILFTSQGIPYLHAGAEFLRTKNGVENSYMSSDEINKLDYYRKYRYMNVYNYYRNLLAFRRNHKAFRMNNVDDIRNSIRFIYAKNNIVAYMIDGNAVGDKYNTILLAFNANEEEFEIDIPKGKWNVVIEGLNINEDSIRTFESEKIVVPSLGSVIMYSDEVKHIESIFDNVEIEHKTLYIDELEKEYKEIFLVDYYRYNEDKIKQDKYKPHVFILNKK